MLRFEFMSCASLGKRKTNTYRSYLPSAEMLSYGSCNGRLLSNAEDLACHAVSSGLYHDAYSEPLPFFSVYPRMLK